MQLKEVMKTEVITAGRDETVTNAARRMREANIGCLVIVDGDSLVGIVTDRDLLIGCLGAGHNPSERQVSDYMSSPVITESPGHGDPDRGAHDGVPEDQASASGGGRQAGGAGVLLGPWSQHGLEDRERLAARRPALCNRGRRAGDIAPEVRATQLWTTAGVL